MNMKKMVVSMVLGTGFGSGLAVSGMLDREKVLGFLDPFGQWDLSLLLVMVGALSVAVPGFFLVQKRQRPVLDAKLFTPTKLEIDGRLIAGAAMFGVGWGLFGFCPGPALANLSLLRVDAVVFVVSMVLGMGLVNRVIR